MIRIKKIFHREEFRIAIFFPVSAPLTVLVKKAGAVWSRTHKCWHVPYTKADYNQLQQLFPEIEVIKESTGGRSLTAISPPVLLTSSLGHPKSFKKVQD